MLICPVCQSALTRQDSSYCCPQAHRFDIAKQGYVNLLLNHQKNTTSPGDNREMVTARRHFLNTGYFQPIAEVLSKFIMILTQGEQQTIVDAGCGEGYYLAAIRKFCYPHWTADEATQHLIGFDISKLAILSAAKHYPQASWLVASNAHIPIADNQADILLSLFGFPVVTEFSRVLANKGKLLVIETGENHLIELRQVIYNQINPYVSKDKLLDSGLFQLLKTERLQYQVTIEQADILNLLQMTPHFYRTTATAKAQLANQKQLSVSIDITVNVYGLSTC